MSEHTPAKLELNGNAIHTRVSPNCGECVAVLERDHPDFEFNRTLFAESHDLLAAAERIEDLICCTPEIGSWIDRDIMTALRAAIAKARGKEEGVMRTCNKETTRTIETEELDLTVNLAYRVVQSIESAPYGDSYSNWIETIIEDVRVTDCSVILRHPEDKGNSLQNHDSEQDRLNAISIAQFHVDQQMAEIRSELAQKHAHEMDQAPASVSR